ncbi:hypothetical protein PA598K_07073, partial [Paenibacillus sp. 598K]
MRLRACFPEATLVNAYGPTECTVDAALYTVPPDAAIDAGAPVPIGRPIANTAVYVLDERLRLQPQGAAGELCIAGIGLARGYRHLPELTATRFVRHPLVPGGWLYRTGDRVRWLEDGTLRYLGRMDEQVKIRGHRIEPEGIASRLRALADIDDAVVVARAGSDGELALHAYYTAAHPLDESALHGELSRALPETMSPLTYTHLAALPLTASGKLDKQALPMPQQAVYGAAGTPPQTDTERRLAAIWQELLGAGTIGSQSHFFALGGHSLKAMLLSGRIRAVFGVELALAELFNHPVLQAQARLIDAAERVGEATLLRADEAPSYPASTAQRRMYVLHQLDSAGVSYSMPQAYELIGPLDGQRLAAALQALVDRYEVLRTVFDVEDGEIVQRVLAELPVELETLDAPPGWGELMAGARAASGEAEAAAALAGDAIELPGGVLIADRTPRSAALAAYMRDWSRPFRLEQPPLLRAGFMELASDRRLLLLDMHHIISDGVTVQLLLADLAALYAGVELQSSNWNYKDYALWQREWLRTEQLAAQEQYWLRQLAGELPQTQLPTDRPRPQVASTAGDSLSFRLDLSLAQQLSSLALSRDCSLYMVLLAAYQTLLHAYTGQQELTIGTPVAGRTHPLSGGMPGLFVNTLVLRAQPRRGQAFDALLRQTRQLTLDAFSHQDYPFEELVERLQVRRDPSRNPLF